ncbi:hypothetical protein SAMN05216249_10433 [Acetitomaculum ruminis DSM 5522]|uniref:Uncharacterized protein n=1 Tax=Acetitomaculum ruminis DSM 5522 TaxID=1120918 RepID=A0A1I0WED5_9FIRM|nr:hypothetical protein [Acetitomaculum ruminis]SFA87072.1 hypothetical protein SAMN05216249_10433 [Acetitomaculum ruminis DSM 5522]
MQDGEWIVDDREEMRDEMEKIRAMSDEEFEKHIEKLKREDKDKR